jgi:hypothetical protein
MLNDRFGIQTRGGCSCAGTYGHVLLQIDFHESQRITQKIDLGDLSEKPGWVRISIHPTMKDKDIDFIIHSLQEIQKNYTKWQDEYKFNVHSGEFELIGKQPFKIDIKDSFSAISN